VNNLRKSLIVALLHILIILSLAGKLVYDRTSRPRIWVRTGSIDPDMPIRGRYFTLNIQVYYVPEPGTKSGTNEDIPSAWQGVELAAENGKLVAHPTDKNTGLTISGRGSWSTRDGSSYMLMPGLPFFIPEHAVTPQLKSGDELWAEVTIPRKGPPRPIQLAIKRGASWMPLTYR
jgi:hypothetical protein